VTEIYLRLPALATTGTLRVFGGERRAAIHGTAPAVGQSMLGARTFERNRALPQSRQGPALIVYES